MRDIHKLSDQARQPDGEPEIEKHGGGQTAFERTPDRGLLRRLGGEAFGDDRLTVRRVRAIRRPCRPLFPDLG